MKKINLSGVDLNLLVVFDALMAERHVTRTAHRIGMTQPAVSHALNRLRALFGDTLFVRTPKGMKPTPTAVQAAEPVRKILESVEGVLSVARRFEPKNSKRTFVIGLSDYAAFVLLPRLLERFETEAPDVRLVVRHTSHVSGLGMLDAGEVELVVGNFPDPPEHMAQELLFEEDFVCAGRRGHPAFSRDLDLKSYLALKHLHVSLKGEPQGYVDEYLRELGLKRDVVVTVGHFLIAPFTLTRTDAIATEPRRIMAPLANTLGFALAAPPIAIPSFPVTQIWHRRFDSDRGHIWLRALLRQIEPDRAR